MEAERNRIGLAMSVYNHVDLTENCLRSVFDDPLRPKYSLSIVNNGSTDHTQDFLLEFASEINSSNKGDSVQVFHNPENLALARAWNQALRALDTDWRVVVSNDVLVPHGWWSELKQAMLQHKLDLAAPFILEGELPANLSEWTESFRKRNKNKFWRDYSFVLFALRAKLLDEVGYLDEHFKVGGLEDTDYIWRMQAAKKKFGIVGATAVYHFGSQTMQDFRQFGDQHFVENLQYFRKKWQLDPRSVENSKLRRMRRRWRRFKLRFGYM